jgi:hypothetical protein
MVPWAFAARKIKCHGVLFRKCYIIARHIVLTKAKLINNLLHSSKLVLRFISSYFVNPVKCLKSCSKYDFDFDSNFADIKRTVINGFKQRFQSRAQS